MELKLKKCYFLQKFNEKKIITLRTVDFHFQYSFCQSRMGFDRQKILSRCGRCLVTSKNLLYIKKCQVRQVQINLLVDIATSMHRISKSARLFMTYTIITSDLVSLERKHLTTTPVHNFLTSKKYLAPGLPVTRWRRCY